MPPKASLPSTPRHIRIFDEDWTFFEAHFGRMSQRPMGVSKAIRGIIHAWAERMKAKADATELGGEVERAAEKGE